MLNIVNLLRKDAADIDCPYFARDTMTSAADEIEHLRAALAAQPALSQKDKEQSAFEDWLISACPSGDVESVQRQWEESSEYLDLQEDTPAQTAPAAVPPEGAIVVSKNEAGQIVCVSRQDEDGQFLSIIAESADAVPLTDEQIEEIRFELWHRQPWPQKVLFERAFARAVLAAAGDKP